MKAAPERMVWGSNWPHPNENVRLMRKLDHVLFVPRPFDRKIEPVKAYPLGQCLRLGILKDDQIVGGLHEQVRKSGF